MFLVFRSSAKVRRRRCWAPHVRVPANDATACWQTSSACTWRAICRCCAWRPPSSAWTWPTATPQGVWNAATETQGCAPSRCSAPPTTHCWAFFAVSNRVRRATRAFLIWSTPSLTCRTFATSASIFTSTMAVSSTRVWNDYKPLRRICINNNFHVYKRLWEIAWVSTSKIWIDIIFL